MGAANGQDNSGARATAHAFDIIGDVHGELPALRQLGRDLGYDVDGGWTHPDNRLLVFLGDLVDRGAHSLEVGELVRDLVGQRRAVCIMGNHEYNLVAHHLGVDGYAKPKHSNRSTLAAIAADTQGRWQSVLEFFRDLPIGIDLPDLRIIHACWHRPSLARIEGHLRVTAQRAPAGADAMAWVLSHVSLRSPFSPTGLLPALPGETADDDSDAPHEVLMKGFEVAAPPFFDNDRKERNRVREVWWHKGASEAYLMDKPQVFGHYWNVPPVDGHFAPPHPSGHPKLRDWSLERVASGKIAPSGRLAMTGDFACVDFNGVTRASKHLACVGALRWPEREMWWATAGKTASSSGEDG